MAPRPKESVGPGPGCSPRMVGVACIDARVCASWYYQRAFKRVILHCPVRSISRKKRPATVREVYSRLHYYSFKRGVLGLRQKTVADMGVQDNLY
jgi:hypothetical protein